MVSLDDLWGHTVLHRIIWHPLHYCAKSLSSITERSIGAQPHHPERAFGTAFQSISSPISTNYYYRNHYPRNLFTFRFCWTGSETVLPRVPEPRDEQCAIEPIVKSASPPGRKSSVQPWYYTGSKKNFSSMDHNSFIFIGRWNHTERWFDVVFLCREREEEWFGVVCGLIAYFELLPRSSTFIN